MMVSMGQEDDLAEVDTTEEEFDAMMAEASPVELSPAPLYPGRYLTGNGAYYTVRVVQGSHASGSQGVSVGWTAQVSDAAGVTSAA